MSPTPRKTFDRPLPGSIQVGTRFGRLEVLENVEANGEGKAMVRVRCECGARVTLEARALVGRPGRWVGMRDCGGHGDPPYLNRYPERSGGGKANGRPGVEAGGYAVDPDWPVAYLVVAGGQRTQHDTFHEAAVEFRLRRGMT